MKPTLDAGRTYAVLGTKCVMSDHCRDGWIAEVGNRVVRLASLNGNIAGCGETSTDATPDGDKVAGVVEVHPAAHSVVWELRFKSGVTEMLDRQRTADGDKQVKP